MRLRRHELPQSVQRMSMLHNEYEHKRRTYPESEVRKAPQPLYQKALVYLVVERKNDSKYAVLDLSGQAWRNQCLLSCPPY